MGPADIRRAAPADLEAVGSLFGRAVALAEIPDTSLAEIEWGIEAIRADPSRTIVSAVDGAITGCLDLGLDLLVVDPAWRRRGHGRALAEAGVRLARDEVGYPYLLLYVPAGDGPGRPFAEATGFSYRASLWSMDRAGAGSGGSVPAPDWPAGIVTRSFEPLVDAIEPYVDLINAAFADHPTPLQVSTARVRGVHARADFDPSNILLAAPAADPGRPVAFAVLGTAVDGTDRHAEIRLIGVLPAWRRRGLGRALLRWAIRRLADHGFDRIRLSVTAANAHALALYEEHGFRRAVEWPQWSRSQ